MNLPKIFDKLRFSTSTKYKFSAFTLAEVLITLGIIGIVAEMTIPTLMGNVNKQLYVTSFSKFYSAYQQGLKTYMANEGCSDLACTSLFDGADSDVAWQTRMDTMLKSNFNITKIYGVANAELSGFKSKDLGNAANTYAYFYNSYSYITADGMLVEIADSGAGNCTDYDTNANGSRMKNACAEIQLDVNGFKPPNTVGRDFFYLVIGNDGMLYPAMGIDDYKAMGMVASAYWRSNSNGCGTAGSSTIASTTSGLGCGARIIEEGWKVNY